MNEMTTDIYFDIKDKEKDKDNDANTNEITNRDQGGCQKLLSGFFPLKYMVYMVLTIKSFNFWSMVLGTWWYWVRTGRYWLPV